MQTDLAVAMQLNEGPRSGNEVSTVRGSGWVRLPIGNCRFSIGVWRSGQLAIGNRKLAMSEPIRYGGRY